MLHLRQSDTKKIDGVDLTHIYSAANVCSKRSSFSENFLSL